MNSHLSIRGVIFMSIEDSIRRSNEALVQSVVMVRTIQEHSDPIKFNDLFQRVLSNQDVTLDSIYENTPYSEEVRELPIETKTELEKKVEDYIGLKSLLQQTAQAGYTFDWDVKKVLVANQMMQQIAGFLGAYNTFCTNLLAVEVIKEFRDTDLSKAEKLDDEGDALNQQGNYSHALPYFDKSLELSPKFSLAWINKGIALKNLGRIDEAIACYDHVINDIDPRYKKAWGNKANLLMTIGETDLARECVDRALEIDPTYQYAQMLKVRMG